MKIRKFYILFSFFAGIFSLTSCSDALDSAPAGRIDMSDVFSDNIKVGAFLNLCYANLPNKGPSYYFSFSRGPVDWCDDAWDATDLFIYWVGSGSMYNGNISAGYNPAMVNNQYGLNENNNWWNIYFTSIRDCNTFLLNIPTATVTNDVDRQRWTAEAHVLRAYYYSELLAWYGCALPIMATPLDMNANFSQVKRSSYYEVVQFIIADCDVALKAGVLPWRIDQPGEARRVTGALAEAIKSRYSLFAASPLYNAGNNHWEDAYTINKKCLADLEANGYELYNKINFPLIWSAPDAHFPNETSAMYNEYFTNTMKYESDPIDKETIYQSVPGWTQFYLNDGIGAQCGNRTGTCPSQELVDAFETTDGQPVLNLADPYVDEKHTTPNYNTANTKYDPTNPYLNRDPRFYADIYYNGSKRTANWQFKEPIGSIENYPADPGNRTRIIATWDGEPKTGLSESSTTMTRTGYYERKFLHPNSGYKNDFGDPNYKLFRLGEVILNFAEAAAEAGHSAEATTAVNRIRKRVGMPDLPSGLPQADLIARIHNERRVEMAMEENRFFDVRRWTAPDGDLSKTDKWVTAIDIKRNLDGTYDYSKRIPVRSAPRQCYTNKYLKMPLTITEANLMQSITGDVWQNPGW